MKIVILTDKSERHYYFCNEIIDKTKKVVGIITGGKKTFQPKGSLVLKKLKRGLYFRMIRKFFLDMLFYNYGKPFNDEKERFENFYFGGSRERFNKLKGDIPHKSVNPNKGSINDQEYVNFIKERNPDVILVMGTCLLSREIMKLAPYVINLHTGLSPYYRGGNTNLWPFINLEYGFFGVTIHHLSSGIDSGDIIYTKRLQVSRLDNFFSINSKSIVLGVKLILKSVSNINNNSLNSKKQWTKGKFYSSLDMNNYIKYKYFLNKINFLAMHRSLQKRNKLAKITQINNGKNI